MTEKGGEEKYTQIVLVTGFVELNRIDDGGGRGARERWCNPTDKESSLQGQLRLKKASELLSSGE